MGKALFFLPNSWQVDGLGDFARVPREKYLKGKERQYNVHLTWVQIHWLYLQTEKIMEEMVSQEFLWNKMAQLVSFLDYYPPPPKSAWIMIWLCQNEDPRNSMWLWWLEILSLWEHLTEYIDLLSHNSTSIGLRLGGGELHHQMAS